MKVLVCQQNSRSQEGQREPERPLYRGALPFQTAGWTFRPDDSSRFCCRLGPGGVAPAVTNNP
ncbi:hypothetical protein [Brevibacillus sp. SAFN-007a]|uniref:hypothetical protein n=1 Tax=Brevibacillus sp. SAFN-007a TaxID=3436862 RepID=UPI003F7E2BDA